MSQSHSQPDSSPETNFVPVAPRSRLSGLGFAVAMVVMASVGIGVYALFPSSVGGPPLPVRVELDELPVEAVGGAMAVLTEVVKITNESDSEIGNLTIELNGLYLLIQASPLAAGETLVLPQEVFTDKRSSKRFDPSWKDVEEVVVTGQLPTRSRGVSKFEFGEPGHSEKK